jgi:hypothetical protein
LGAASFLVVLGILIVVLSSKLHDYDLAACHARGGDHIVTTGSGGHSLCLTPDGRVLP